MRKKKKKKNFFDKKQLHGPDDGWIVRNIDNVHIENTLKAILFIFFF